MAIGKVSEASNNQELLEIDLPMQVTRPITSTNTITATDYSGTWEGYTNDLSTQTSSANALILNGTNIQHGNIIENYAGTNDGYVKYADGTMMEWKSLTTTIGGTAWGSLGYSDHTMGDWLVPFTAIYNAWSNVNAVQHWTSCEYWTTTSAGQIRAFRPNTGTRDATITITGIGKWK
jgi:hypothetical protein